MTKITYIPSEIANAAIDEHGNRKPVTRTQHIFDDVKNKSQAEVNADIDNTFALHQSEINALNSQNYVTVDSFNALPATGEADTIYRVSNWDGTQQDPSVYSEYAWNGSQYIHLSTKTQIGEVFDISAYHATGGTLAKYADLAAALDGGNNIPQSLRKGGMSIKYVQTSDNKYVQWRYMLSSTTNANFANVANWQGVDDEIKQGSKNIIESGIVFELDSCVVDSNINMEFTTSYVWIITQDNTIERVVSSYGSQMSCSKGFITVIKGQKYNVSTVVLGAAKKVILTDEAGNVISSYNANTAEVVIPNGATRMYINKATNKEFSVSVYNIKYYIEKLLTDLSTITPTVLSDNKNLNNLLSSIGLVNQELTLSTGFYESNLTKNTSTGWKCVIVDIENYDGLIIYASVRDSAYISLTDSENNILWQSNSRVLYKEVDKSSYPTATKLYLSNETSALKNPFVFGSKYPNKLISISRLESAINNLPTLIQPIIDKELYGANIPFTLTSGFYKRDLSTGTSDTFKKSILTVDGYGYKEIIIHASVRDDAYVSLVDANNAILWQRNSINDTVVDLTEFPTADKLYLSNETSVVANPYVKGIKKIIYEIEQLDKKVSLLGSNRLAHVSFDDVHYCLEDITTNASNYNSLFDSRFFSKIKELHQDYGMVFSLFVFQTATAADGVSTWHLSDVTNKFESEFSANSDWLRFGMHSGVYSDFVTEIIRITGNPKCIDMVPRFDSFAGSLSYCKECRDSNCGIIGLLCADDDRNSYYLGSEKSSLVFNKGKYFDAENQLFFFRTLTRLEWHNVHTILNSLMSASEYSISNNAIIFTHEYEFFNSNFNIVTNRLDQLRVCGQWCNSHDYYWGFLMDKIRKTF